jgi:hypothetical protein
MFILGNIIAQHNKPLTQDQTKQLFIENRGQWPNEVLFLTQTNGLNAWITSNGIIYDFNQNLRIPGDLEQHTECSNNVQKRGHVSKIKFINCSPSSKITSRGENKVVTQFNYILGNNSENWIYNVNAYRQVLVKNIYLGIDVNYYYDQDGLRYDLIVSPFANADNIKLQVEGASDVKAAGSELSFNTSLGEVKQTKLFAYQDLETGRNPVECSFTMLDDCIAGFKLGDFSNEENLIIDPLLFSGVFGGSMNDVVSGIKVDWIDKIIIAGKTESANFPVVFGAYNITYEANIDAFISRFDPTGSTLLSSTFLGGSGSDIITALDIDNLGSVYFTGTTTSLDFPVSSGAVDTVYNGLIDGFVCKMNQALSVLNFASYIGAGLNDEPVDIVVSNGNVSITGITNSAQFPTTNGVIATSFAGGYDLFLTAFDAGFSSLVFSTLWGNINNDLVVALELDQTGNYILAGNRKEVGSSIQNSFVLKINSAGSTQLYFNSIGGSSTDVAYDMTLDQYDNIYVCGRSFSSNLLFPANAYDQVNNSNKAFIYKLTNQGAFAGGTFFGSVNTIATSIDISDYGKPGIAGITQGGLPVTSTAFDTTYNGGVSYGDAFFTQFNQDLTTLLYCTYLGGTGDERLGDFIYDNSNNPLVAGYTSSANYPLTSGAYASVSPEANDLFLTNIELKIAQLKPFPSCYDSNTGSITVELEGGESPYSYFWNNGTSGQTAYSLSPGVYTVTILDANNLQQVLSDTITENAQIDLAATFLDVNCHGESTGVANLAVTGGTLPYNFSWSTGDSVTYLPGLVAGQYSYTFYDAVNCITIDTFIIHQPPALNIISSIIHCSNVSSNNGSITTSTSGGMPPYNYLWSNGSNQISISTLTVGIYQFSVSDANGCLSANSYDVEVFVPFELDTVIIEAISCYQSDDGAVELYVAGNYEPFEFVWSNGDSDSQIDSLAPGSYEVTIIDTRSDSLFYTYNLTEPDSLKLYPFYYPIKCNGDSSEISILVTGGTQPYFGDIDTFLYEGIHTFEIYDANGCQNDTTIHLMNPPPLQINLIVINATGEQALDGAIDAIILGGEPPYIYAWSNGSTQEDLLNSETGSYSLTVTDDLGCSVSDTAFIDYTVGIKDNSDLINTLGVYPNPAKDQLTFSFTLLKAGNVMIELYNALGQPSALLLNEYCSNGTKEKIFDISNIHAGLYFYRININDQIINRQLIVIK